jgi:hypothetical protein
MAATESNNLALALMRQLTETVERLAALSEDDLTRDVDHGCAMDGGLRRLLVHNAEHDRQHAAPISNARQRARQMPEAELPRLIRDLIHQRAEVVSLLLGMDDALLQAQPANDDWTVREHVEHLLYWEDDSMSAAVRDLAHGGQVTQQRS